MGLVRTSRIDPYRFRRLATLSDRAADPEKLYGREREMGRMLASFDGSCGGKGPCGQLVLVSGLLHAAYGKSSEVNERHKVLVTPRGMFESWQVQNQYKTATFPTATVGQAFQTLSLSLLMTGARAARDGCCGGGTSLSDGAGPDLWSLDQVQSLVPERWSRHGKKTAPPGRASLLPPKEAQRERSNCFAAVSRCSPQEDTSRSRCSLGTIESQWLGPRPRLTCLRTWPTSRTSGTSC